MKVLFSPEYPGREFYTIVPVFMRLGYFAVMDAGEQFDFGFAWQDVTWMAPDPLLDQVARSKPVVNLHCRDISKRRVEAAFERVFGYSTFVDPLTGTGSCVKKFDENARGGWIVQRPLAAAEEGYIYQTFIDAVRDNRMIEYRVPVVLGRVPVVYRVAKAVPTDRIKTGKQSVQLTGPEQVFSGKEIELILEFCRDMGLDFGELDILRANADGRIYILDANKTPGGFGMRNHVNWTREDRDRAIGCLAEAFQRSIEGWLDAVPG